jgi:formyltetrahydrofolate-dependent phosphoribosylglycinamide formyltransferase
MRVAVLASGGGTNLEALIDACGTGAPATVALVLSNNPQADALRRATRAGIPTGVLHHPDDGTGLLEQLRGHRADLVVLAGYLKLVPRDVVDALAGRMINIHPALLPAFGGGGMYGINVHRAVLTSGATVSGASVHLVDAVYDRGRIVAQWPVPVQRDDTPEALHERVLAVEHQLLPAVVLAAARAGKVVRMVAGAGYFGEDRPIADQLIPVEMT